jgi:hypothetical protein
MSALGVPPIVEGFLTSTNVDANTRGDERCDDFESLPVGIGEPLREVFRKEGS